MLRLDHADALIDGAQVLARETGDALGQREVHTDVAHREDPRSAQAVRVELLGGEQCTGRDDGQAEGEEEGAHRGKVVGEGLSLVDGQQQTDQEGDHAQVEPEQGDPRARHVEGDPPLARRERRLQRRAGSRRHARHDT